MKVLALLGSPRRNGNTDIMAEEVLRGCREAGAETNVIAVDNYLVRPIAEVGDKSSERDDPRRDDDFPSLLEKFLGADIIIWATPVYWAGLSAQLKCFLDRMSSYFNREPYKHVSSEKVTLFFVHMAVMKQCMVNLSRSP